MLVVTREHENRFKLDRVWFHSKNNVARQFCIWFYTSDLGAKDYCNKLAMSLARKDTDAGLRALVASTNIKPEQKVPQVLSKLQGKLV